VYTVHPVFDRHFGYTAPLLDLAGFSTDFSVAITTQFSFRYSLGGVTAMPRGLHARRCRAFLVVVVVFVRDMSAACTFVIRINSAILS